MSTPDCTYNAKTCDCRCCPLPAACNQPPPYANPNACAACRQVYTKTGALQCRYQTKYTKPYRLYRLNGCVTISNYSKAGLLNFFPSIAKAEETTHYPRMQGGRWNHSTTNTKLFPIIYHCKQGGVCSKPNTPDCASVPATNHSTFIQSGKLFKNTDYQMPKHELVSYLARNRKYLNR